MRTSKLELNYQLIWNCGCLSNSEGQIYSDVSLKSKKMSKIKHKNYRKFKITKILLNPWINYQIKKCFPSDITQNLNQ